MLLAELKGTQQLYAVKALKKDVVLMMGEDVGYIMTEKAVLQLSSQHPYLTQLHCTFQSEVYYLQYIMTEKAVLHLSAEHP